MIKQSFKLYVSTISFLALAHPSIASKIDIVNENKKALTVKIKGEGDNTRETLTTHTKEIPAEVSSTFIISKSDINNKTFYSIKGETGSFSPSGRCEYLNVDKNYKVTFLNNASGTNCIAEPRN